MNVFILYYTHTHTYIYTFIPFILFYLYIYIPWTEGQVLDPVCLCLQVGVVIYLSIYLSCRSGQLNYILKWYRRFGTMQWQTRTLAWSGFTQSTWFHRLSSFLAIVTLLPTTTSPLLWVGASLAFYLSSFHLWRVVYNTTSFFLTIWTTKDIYLWSIYVRVKNFKGERESGIYM